MHQSSSDSSSSKEPHSILDWFSCLPPESLIRPSRIPKRCLSYISANVLHNYWFEFSMQSNTSKSEANFVSIWDNLRVAPCSTVEEAPKANPDAIHKPLPQNRDTNLVHYQANVEKHVTEEEEMLTLRVRCQNSNAQRLASNTEVRDGEVAFSVEFVSLQYPSKFNRYCNNKHIRQVVLTLWDLKESSINHHIWWLALIRHQGTYPLIDIGMK